MNAIKSIDQVKKADVVKRIVVRCIASKVWKSECVAECNAYVTKDERAATMAYVNAEYEKAGAGFNGRWQ